MKLRQHYEILPMLGYEFVEMFGRPVLMKSVWENQLCSDCKVTDAAYQIFEFNKDSWYWCGKCDVKGEV